MICAFQIEILKRELDGVLYQALHFANKGLPTLIGDRMTNEYIKQSNAPLIYLDKDQQKHTNEIVLKNGGIVLNNNAEGQGFVDHPKELQQNFAKVIDYATSICTWGVKQREILKSFIPEDRHKDILATGHPSFDLAAPQFNSYYKNDDIVRTHGTDYFLINTSFGMFNHEMGFERYVKMLGKMDEWKVYGEEKHLAHLRNRCAHQEKTALSLIDLARKLSSAYPNRHIIIRPHPAENPTYYSKQLSDIDNVTVTKEGSAREWIATAGVVIHHDCTTGLEATLMGKLVLQYEPYEGIEGGAKLMTRIGLRTTSPEQALEHIKTNGMPETDRDKLLNELSPYLANIQSNAASTLAEIAVQHATQKEYWLPKPLGTWGNIKCWRKYISKLLRAKQPGKNGRKVSYALNKFSRLYKEEVESKLAKLRNIEPTLPEVTVEQLCLNTFLIKPRQ